MKKTILALSLAFALLFSLTACTSQGAQPTASPAVDPAQSTGAPVADPAQSTADTVGAKPDNYPKGAITCLVGYSAGGGSDMAVRTFGEYFTPLLGDAFTISNVTGGSGTVAVSQLKHSNADGYTMGLTTLNTQAISPFTLDVDYAVDDFDYLGGLGKFVYAVVVAADSPYQTFDELLADAKTKPIQCTGTGTLHEILGNKISAATGGTFEVVYYPATTDAITDLLGGFIPAAIGDIASYSSYIEAGQMRVLACASEERWPITPDVETLIEMGYPDTTMDSYVGIALPKGIDADVLAFLRAQFDTVVNDKTFQDKLYEVTKLIPVQMTADEYHQLLIDTYAENEVALADK